MRCLIRDVSLQPASKTVIVAALDKARPNLPAKPAVPAAAPATAVRGRGLAPPGAVAAAAAAAPSAVVSNGAARDEDDAKAAVKGLRPPSKAKVSPSFVRRSRSESHWVFGFAHAQAGGAGSASTSAPGAAAKSGRKKDEDVDTSPLLQSNNLKTQRVNDELKLRVLKWNFAVPRDEFVEQVR